MKTFTSFDISVWQDFCYDLIEAKKRDIAEAPYQEMIELGLRQLGWSKVKGEICPKERINVGSCNQLEPDITMKIEGEPVFIIEVKRPSNSITKRQTEQLLSYMRMWKKSFGLYIGDEIQLYYDDGSLLPAKVWNVKLSLDSKDGTMFIDLFHRKTFNETRLINFCKSKYNEQKTNIVMSAFTQSLASNQDAAIRQALLEYFVDYKKCDKNLVQTILEPYHFSSNQSGGSANTSFNSPNVHSSGIILTTNASTNAKKNTTKYSLDGGETKFGKGRFVREVVEAFLKQNPLLTYNQIHQIFPDNLQGSYGVVRTISELNESKQNKKDLFSRYVINAPLVSSDGIEFVVCNQWGTYNFANILNILDKWGWNIISE